MRGTVEQGWRRAGARARQLADAALHQGPRVLARLYPRRRGRAAPRRHAASASDAERDRRGASTTLRGHDARTRPTRAHACRTPRRPTDRRPPLSRRDGASRAMSITWRVRVGDAEVGALREPATTSPSVGTFFCAHGAGGNMHARGMQAVANELRARGLDVVRFNFPYSERKSSRPDPMPVLQACIEAVVGQVQAARVIIGG